MTLAAAGDIACLSSPPPGDGAPVADPSPFVKRRNGQATLDLAVVGARCSGCIAKIETGVGALPGVEAARLNLSTGKLAIAWSDGALHPRRIIERLAALGYHAAPYDPGTMDREDDATGRALLRAMAVAGFASANIMLLSVSVWAGHGEMGDATRTLLHWISGAIAVPAALYAGRPFFRSAVGALRVRQANMDVPISLGIILSLSISIFETMKNGPHAYFDAAVMLVFFLLIGRFLDHRLRAKARAAARDLLALQAKTASRITSDGMVEAVATRDLRPGDLIALAPGDRAPIDAEIVEGSSDVDLSLVTGESAPVRRSSGALLHAGVLNLSSRLVVRAKARVEDSLLADLARLIEAGEQTKGQYVRLADRAARLYVPLVHSLALVTFLFWFFIVDAGLRISILHAVALLIITCPCALGLAAPAVQVVATGQLFRSGIFVRSGDALERLSEIDTVVFDKTGTLTFGRQRISNPDQVSARALAGAAQLARCSRHPLSRAIVSVAGQGQTASDTREEQGAGVEGVVDGVVARLGRADWVGAHDGDGDATEVWYRRGMETPVRITFEDEIRPDAKTVIAALKARGLKILMLTGDLDRPARAVAEALGGIDHAARLTPMQKIEKIRALTQAGAKVAMIGDGLNDAPSLAAAHASLSPGTAADASQAAADFVYQGERLRPIVEAVDMARSARRRMLENFAFAALYNVCAVPLAAFGYVTPLIAALAMSGSSIVVTLNALRLASRRKEAR